MRSGKENMREPPTRLGAGVANEKAVEASDMYMRTSCSLNSGEYPRTSAAKFSFHNAQSCQEDEAPF
jgi:hypothetical protein